MTNLSKLSIPSKPPITEKELLYRANSLAGITLFELTKNYKIIIPENLKKNKGWIGILLENYLGANDNLRNQSKQDFSNIGVELKTIPINKYGNPLETTFICMVSLTKNIGIYWETSYIRYKLSRILWIPIEGDRDIPLYKRRIGKSFLWSPTLKEEIKLKNDWEELMDFITLGNIENLTSYYGDVLQIRPKAANSRILTSAIGKMGQKIFTIPRGFYLRKNFTNKILNNFYY